MGSHLARRRRPAALAAVLALVLGIGVAATAGASGPDAHAARVLRVRDSASLHLTHKSGNILHEAGSASGSLPGSVTATFNTSRIVRVTGSVTFRTGAGSITMDAVGYPSGGGTVVSFSGNIAVRSGTRRYRNAVGSGSFRGTLNRRTWAVRISRANARVNY